MNCVIKVAIEDGDYDIWFWYHAFQCLSAGVHRSELSTRQVGLGEAGDIICIGASGSVSP
jgi:hypothetical protein